MLDSFTEKPCHLPLSVIGQASLIEPIRKTIRQLCKGLNPKYCALTVGDAFSVTMTSLKLRNHIHHAIDTATVSLGDGGSRPHQAFFCPGPLAQARSLIRDDSIAEQADQVCLDSIGAALADVECPKWEQAIAAMFLRDLLTVVPRAKRYIEGPYGFELVED